MKRVAAVVVVSLCCWFSADVAHSACNPQDKTATVVINVGDDTFSYANKIGDPVPCFFRNRPIEITVNFPASSPSNHYIEMKDFRALFFVGQQGNGGWVHDFDDPYVLKITGGDTDTSVKFENDADHTVTKTITLQSLRGPGGPNRLITFTLVIAGGNGQPLVTFDPPWGERP